MPPRLLRKSPSQPVVKTNISSPTRTLTLSPMSKTFDSTARYSAYLPTRPILEEDESDEPLFHDSYLTHEDRHLRERFRRPPSPPDINQFLSLDDESDYEEDLMEDDEELDWYHSTVEVFLAKVVEIVRLGRPKRVDIARPIPLKPIQVQVQDKERGLGHAKQLSQASTSTTGSSSDAETHSSSMSRTPSVSSATTNSEQSKTSPASSIYEMAKTPEDFTDKSFFHDDWSPGATSPYSEYCDQMFEGISPGGVERVNHPFRSKSDHSKSQPYSRPLPLGRQSFQLQIPPPKRTSSIYSRAPPTPMSTKSSRAPSIDLTALDRRPSLLKLTPPQSPDTKIKRAGGIFFRRNSTMASAR